MASTITMRHDVTLVLHECWSCGVIYGISSRLDTKRREDGGSFYCPNGHGAVFKETETQRLTRELQIAQQQIARAEDERNAAQRSEATTKRELVRVNKRAHAGVCPCCNRSFVNVARHMKTKHPNVEPIKRA